MKKPKETMPFDLKKFKNLKNLGNFKNFKKSKYKPKIWIYADMEGVNNITRWKEVNPAFIQYKKGAELMTEEVCSAIKGAIKGGVGKIFLNDLHWFSNNLDWSKIDKDVISCAGSNLNISDFFLKYFDAVFIVGMHAKNKASNAILPHSWYSPSDIDSLRYDNRLIGEVDMIKLLAEEKGVPVLFINGDKAGCDEALEICSHITTAETKSINERGEIELLSRKKANKLIYNKAKASIKAFRNNPNNYKTNTTVSKFPLKATFTSKEITNRVKNRCKILNLNYRKINFNTIQFNGNCFSQILKNFFSVLD